MKDRSRIIIELTSEEQRSLKKASAKIGISMKDFLLLAAFEKLEKLEEKWLIDKARKNLKNIQSGKEKTISWIEIKKRLS